MLKASKHIFLKYMKKIKTNYDKLIYIFPIFIFSFLVFANLNNRAMYIDESVTAMLGKNILSFGYPKVWDGNNLTMAAVNGNEFNEALIYIRDNWLAYYIAALGQLMGRVIGCDVSSCVLWMRILFAIIGVLGIIFFYFFVKDLARNRDIIFISLLIYATSVPLLLHLRSIYYVALIPTFVIATMYFYRKTVKEEKWKSCILFIISAILLFHSLFLHFFIIIFSITSIYFIFDLKKSNIKYLIVSVISIGIFTIPWWIYQRMFLNKVEISWLSKSNRFFDNVLGYIWQIQAYFFPFITLGLIALIFILIKKIKKEKVQATVDSSVGNKSFRKKFFYVRVNKKNKSDRYRSVLTIASPIFFNILIVSLFSSFLETRWLFACIPFLFIVTAYLIAYIKKQVYFIGVCLLTILLFTNGLHIMPYLLVKQLKIGFDEIEKIIKPPVPFYNANNSGWLNKKANLIDYLDTMCYLQSYPINLVEEISNEFYDADKGMILFFNKYSNKDQKVYLVGFQFETISYYNGMKVVNRLDPEMNPLPNFYYFYPNATRYNNLTEYPILQCDWIVERNESVSDAEWHNSELFEKIYIDFPESEPWNEIWAHTFYTDSSFPGFYIYRNRKTTTETDLKGIFSIDNTE